MTDKTALGDRMKEYEAVTRAMLPRRAYAIIRVDGRAFHTLLRNAVKPFDAAVSDAMEEVAIALCQEASGVVLAYAQSDEVSVLLTDFASEHSQPWFGGGVQKIASVSAAIATAMWNDTWSLLSDDPPSVRLATFDARVFTITTAPEVANYFVWRQRDATRNSISMAAQAHFPHRELQGKDGNEMQEMLWSHRGVNWNDYPARWKRGSVITRAAEPGTVTYTDKRTQEEKTAEVTRNRWKASGAPHFTAEPGSWLAGMIPPLPAL